MFNLLIINRMSNQNAIEPSQTIIQVIWQNQTGMEVLVKWPDGHETAGVDFGNGLGCGPANAALNADDILSFSVTPSDSTVTTSDKTVNVDLRFEPSHNDVTSFSVSCPAGSPWVAVPFTRDHDSGPYTITLVKEDNDGFVIVGTVELVDTSHLPT
ncbi:MAG: hypothetical protein U0176_25215 [Bacteroidia bacterium]